MCTHYPSRTALSGIYLISTTFVQNPDTMRSSVIGEYRENIKYGQRTPKKSRNIGCIEERLKAIEQSKNKVEEQPNCHPRFHQNSKNYSSVRLRGASSLNTWRPKWISRKNLISLPYYLFTLCWWNFLPGTKWWGWLKIRWNHLKTDEDFTATYGIRLINGFHSKLGQIAEQQLTVACIKENNLNKTCYILK